MQQFVKYKWNVPEYWIILKLISTWIRVSVFPVLKCEKADILSGDGASILPSFRRIDAPSPGGSVKNMNSNLFVGYYCLCLHYWWSFSLKKSRQKKLNVKSCLLQLVSTFNVAFFGLWCYFFHLHTFLNHFLFKPTFLPSLCAAPSLHVVVFLKRTTWKHIFMCCIWTTIHSVEPDTCPNTTTVPSPHIAYHSRYNSFKPRWVQ